MRRIGRRGSGFERLSRREFLGTAAAPLILPALPILGCRPSEGRAGTRAAKDEAADAPVDVADGPRVALAADPGVVESRNRTAGVRELMTRALGGAGGGEPGDFLAGLLGEDERIGIKVNMLAGRGMSTSVDVVEALVAEIRAAGRGGGGVVVVDRLK